MGLERAKIVSSYLMVSIETIIAAHIPMKRIVGSELVILLSLTSMSFFGIQSFRLTESWSQHYSFQSQSLLLRRLESSYFGYRFDHYLYLCARR